jgi:hypothetical protein
VQSFGEAFPVQCSVALHPMPEMPSPDFDVIIDDKPAA